MGEVGLLRGMADLCKCMGIEDRRLQKATRAWRRPALQLDRGFCVEELPKKL